MVNIMINRQKKLHVKKYPWFKESTV